MRHSREPESRYAPPPIDLSGHFRSLATVLLPAIAIGLLVGVLVFAARTAFVAKEYSASVITQITPGREVIPGDAFVEQLRAPFIALAQDEKVLSQTTSQLDNGWSTGELASHVTTEPGTTPSLLVVTATASSPELAKSIAEAMVTSMSDAATSNFARDAGRRADQIETELGTERSRNQKLPANSTARKESDARVAELEGQLAALRQSPSASMAVLSVPAASSAPVTPRPVQEGAVAGLIAAIVAAEAMVLIRGRMGRRANIIWARRMASKYDAPLTTIGRSGDELTELNPNESAVRVSRGDQRAPVERELAQLQNAQTPAQLIFRKGKAAKANSADTAQSAAAQSDSNQVNDN